eukprot:3708805-Prymnesium_polylepis.4
MRSAICVMFRSLRTPHMLTPSGGPAAALDSRQGDCASPNGRAHADASLPEGEFATAQRLIHRPRIGPAIVGLKHCQRVVPDAAITHSLVQLPDEAIELVSLSIEVPLSHLDGIIRPKPCSRICVHTRLHLTVPRLQCASWKVLTR